MNNLFNEAQEGAAEFVPETVPVSQLFSDVGEGSPRIDFEPEQQFQSHNTGTLPGSNTEQKTALNVGQSVPAAVVVGLIDNVFPPALSALISLAGYDIPAKALKMNAAEKKYLEEPTQSYLNTINVTLSPFEGFLIALGSVYAGKAADIIMNGAPAKRGRKPNAGSDDADIDINAANIGAKRGRKPRSDKGKPNPNNSRVQKNIF